MNLVAVSGRDILFCPPSHCPSFVFIQFIFSLILILPIEIILVMNSREDLRCSLGLLTHESVCYALLSLTRPSPTLIPPRCPLFEHKHDSFLYSHQAHSQSSASVSQNGRSDLSSFVGALVVREGRLWHHCLCQRRVGVSSGSAGTRHGME